MCLFHLYLLYSHLQCWNSETSWGLKHLDLTCRTSYVAQLPQFSPMNEFKERLLTILNDWSINRESKSGTMLWQPVVLPSTWARKINLRILPVLKYQDSRYRDFTFCLRIPTQSMKWTPLEGALFMYFSSTIPHTDVKTLLILPCAAHWSTGAEYVLNFLISHWSIFISW